MTSQELKQWRVNQEWTQDRLAAELDVPLRTLKRWEGGGVIPHPKMLRLAIDRLQELARNPG